MALTTGPSGTAPPGCPAVLPPAGGPACPTSGCWAGGLGQPRAPRYTPIPASEPPGRPALSLPLLQWWLVASGPLITGHSSSLPRSLLSLHSFPSGHPPTLSTVHASVHPFFLEGSPSLPPVIPLVIRPLSVPPFVRVPMCSFSTQSSTHLSPTIPSHPSLSASTQLGREEPSVPGSSGEAEAIAEGPGARPRGVEGTH